MMETLRSTATGEGALRLRGTVASPVEPIAPGWSLDEDAFSHAFNEEFAPLLHVFAADGVAAANAGPSATATTLGLASGPDVSASRLRELFTPRQIALIQSFCSTHRVPSLLFDGAEVGATTAQQRILMAGHILATGDYEPGSFAQRLHARMCGHWANLVHTYAGCGNAGSGAGIREEFDLEGHLALSASTTGGDAGAPERTGAARREGVYHDSRHMREDEFLHPDEAPVRSRWELHGAPWDEVQAIEPGDWLWVFNDNGGGGGNHSVIFSRWASAPEQTGSGIRFRRAICMSQLSPTEGGRTHTALLGERYTTNADGHRVTPVVHIERMASDTVPVTTRDQLVSVLGSGPEREANEAYLQRLERRDVGRHIDRAALAEALVGRNRALIDGLAATNHITPDQVAVFRATNTGDDLGILVRLLQRLQVWTANAAALDAGHAHDAERVEGSHSEAEARIAPQRATLEAQLEDIDDHVTALTDQQAREDAVVAATDLSDDLARVRAARRADLAARRAARAALREGPADRRDALERALEDIDDRLTQAVADIAALVERAGDGTHRAAVHTARHTAGELRRELARRTTVANTLRELVGSVAHYTAHMGDRDRFNGRGEQRADGLLAHLDPQPDWSSLMIGP